MINTFLISFLLPLLVAIPSYADPQSKADLRVAIIDTGFTFGILNVPVCPSGHRDFTTSGTLKDENSMHHGSNVADLIAREAGPKGYCVLILKVFNDEGFDEAGYYRALAYVATQDVQVVNLSIAGTGMLLEETILIKKLLDKGITLVIAAGNGKYNLDLGCIVSPACIDSRAIVVGNYGAPNSNTGAIIDFYVDGKEQVGGGTTLTGTSQATAIVTGRLIKQALQLRSRGL